MSIEGSLRIISFYFVIFEVRGNVDRERMSKDEDLDSNSKPAPPFQSPAIEKCQICRRPRKAGPCMVPLDLSVPF